MIWQEQWFQWLARREGHELPARTRNNSLQAPASAGAEIKKAERVLSLLQLHDQRIRQQVSGLRQEVA